MKRLFKKIKYRYHMYRLLSSLKDEYNISINNLYLLKKHLLESENRLTPEDLDNLSPIPRHDLSEFNRLVIGEDLPRHPNPKMEGSPYTKEMYSAPESSKLLKGYALVFNRLSNKK